ncbi:MAG: HigA family addiction module antidote protein [Planctomycetes bacterium]|nr:HigA family addiction module antidote protein [Planctomycetota bacterium]
MAEAGLPTRRRPTTPGEVILEEYLKPLDVTQTELAAALHIPLQRVNLIIKGKRAVTPDTALRLSRCLGGSIQSWLNLQHAVDLYDAIVATKREDLAHIPHLAAAG